MGSNFFFWDQNAGGRKLEYLYIGKRSDIVSDHQSPRQGRNGKEAKLRITIKGEGRDMGSFSGRGKIYCPRRQLWWRFAASTAA